MAEMTIQLKTNPETGKKDIIVSLTSDDDSLPHEHEEMHRDLVDKLIEGGGLKATEIGTITVEREQENREPAAPVSRPEQDQRQSHSEGS